VNATTAPAFKPPTGNTNGEATTGYNAAAATNMTN
jgi:hypothetical protein